MYTSIIKEEMKLLDNESVTLKLHSPQVTDWEAMSSKSIIVAIISTM